MMKAGFAEVVITPPDGRYLLAGYGLPWSTGVHDDLYASAVYLQDGEALALLISFDLLAMERDLIARLKDAVRAILPIPAGSIFFTCTHTHEGPEVRERKFRDHWGPHERPEYLDGYQRFLMERVAEVAAAAAAEAQEFDLVVNRAYVDENVNRRFFLTDETYLSIPGNKHLLDVAREHADKELGILAFCPPGSRRPFGLIANYTMHPLTAGNTSTLISADVPGVVRAVIRESIGCPACYITGAAGDNHPKASEAGFAETRRVGQVLGTEVVRRSSDGFRIAGPVHLRCLTRSIPLRYRTYDDFLRIPLHGVNESVLDENFKRVEKPGATIDVEFSLLAIGPVLFIGVPGEMLAELGSVLKWFSPFKRTYIMYQATESFDYIAHPNAFLWGGFEIVCAQLSPDSVRPLINAIIDAAEELSRQPVGEGGDQA
jgi:neutral ceramidase